MKRAITLERQLAELTTAHRRQVRKLVTIRSLWFAVLAALALLYSDLFFQFDDPIRLVSDVVFVAGLLAIVALFKLVREEFGD